MGPRCAPSPGAARGAAWPGSSHPTRAAPLPRGCTRTRRAPMEARRPSGRATKPATRRCHPGAPASGSLSPCARRSPARASRRRRAPLPPSAARPPSTSRA
eukprot:scaffold98103_cov29-Tisochrysis_lutea.AAC.3